MEETASDLHFNVLFELWFSSGNLIHCRWILATENTYIELETHGLKPAQKVFM